MRQAPKPPLRRSRHAAAGEGASIAGAASPYSDDELSEIRDALQPSERTPQTSGAHRAQGGGRAAARRSHWNVFDAIVTGVNKTARTCACSHPPAEGRVMRGERGMDVGERVRVRLTHTDPVRGFIDFEGV